MSSNKELDNCYMKCAISHSCLSKAKRKKVGAVLVTNTGVLVGGVNGLPTVLGNDLEYKEYNTDNLEMSDEYPLIDDNGDYRLVTKEEVIHAELNCILKCAKEGIDTRNCTIYITLSPCVKCSSMIIASGVKRVVYMEEYRVSNGLKLLRDAGIEVDKL